MLVLPLSVMGSSYMYRYRCKKKLRPETYESKGYAGRRRSGDGAPSTPVRGHQVASEHHLGTSEKGGWAKLGTVVQRNKALKNCRIGRGLRIKEVVITVSRAE